MRKILFLTFIATVMATAHAVIATPKYNYEFADNSPLAQGKWVTVDIFQTGVHEISYATLRSLGFSNPAAVSVYAMDGGGRMRETDFQYSNGSVRYYNDNLAPVAVNHVGDKLYFYAQGTSYIRYHADATYYDRKSKNIYSDKAVYFLTDSQQVKAMEHAIVSDKQGAYHRTEGFGFDYREDDNVHSPKGKGQIFTAADLKGNTTLEYQLNLPYLNTESTSKGYAQVAQAISSSATDNYSSLTITVGDVARQFTTNETKGEVYTRVVRNVTFNKGIHKLILQTLNANMAYNELDWWIVSYPKTLSLAIGDPDFSEELVTYRTQSLANALRVDVPEGSMAWDVSDPANPVILEVEGTSAYIPAPTYQSSVVVFDPRKEHNALTDGFRPLANQNLHALADGDYEMVIITTNEYEPYARRIADLHKKYDDMNVYVVTQDLLFNEFSGAIPDPMAYRAFLKLIWQKHEQKLKNVLLFGPLWADVRNIGKSINRPEGLIAYPQPGSNFDEYPLTIYDFYGFMTDYIANDKRPDNAIVELGVGYLPIHSMEMAELAISKIEEQLSRDDFSHIVNESLSMCCDGDENAHERQAEDIRTLLNRIQRDNYNSRMSHQIIWGEKCGHEGARDAFTKLVNRGKLLNIYYGHATSGFLAFYLYSRDFDKLDNNDLGFMFFAGCDLSVPEHGMTGIGETGVTRAKRGLFGSIMASRQVMSNYNFDFSVNFFRGLYSDINGTPRTKSPTLGEAYAVGKSKTENESENAYVLIGDPALRMPVALGKISLTTPSRSLHPGETVRISGSVLGTDGAVNKDYNGRVAIKICHPAQSIYYKTETISGIDYPHYMEYDAILLTELSAEVNAGTFTADVTIPAEASQFMGSGDVELPVYAGAYCHPLRLGTSGYTTIRLAAAGEVPGDDASFDTTAPAATFSYDNDLRSVTISAADASGIIPGLGAAAGTHLFIDGCEWTVNERDTEAAVTSYTTTLSMARLAEGEHSYRLYTVDMAGNASSTLEGTFTIAPVTPIQLSASSRLAIKDITFRIDGPRPEGLLLSVTDREGKTMARIPAESRYVTLDTDGYPIGTYSVSVCHDSAAGAMINSNKLEFSVIE